MSILLILIVLAAVEIVRIVLDQCIQPRSLLKKTIRVVFVCIIDFIAGLLLGVIGSLRIESLITSLFALVMPETEGNFEDDLETVLSEAIEKEILDITDDPAGYSEEAHYQKVIWRRKGTDE